MNKLAMIVNRPASAEDNDIFRDAGMHPLATAGEKLACIYWANGRRNFDTYCALIELAKKVSAPLPDNVAKTVTKNT